MHWNAPIPPGTLCQFLSQELSSLNQLDPLQVQLPAAQVLELLHLSTKVRALPVF